MRYVLLLYFFLSAICIVAQSNPFYSDLVQPQQSKYCGFDIMHQRMQNASPKVKMANEKFNQGLYQLLNKRKGGDSSSAGLKCIGCSSISVVVHIIHNNGPENIPDSQVITAIGHLNNAFRNRSYYDSLTGVDVEIEFCLAKQSPNGCPTNGINRINIGQNGIGQS